MPRPFATCGSCAHAWPTWDDFVRDSQLRLLGFQGTLGHPDTNLLVFEHRCGSSVSVLTKRLRHLLPDHPARHWPSLLGTIECPGHCLSLADLEACDRPCSNARDRDLIKLVQGIKRGS